MAKENKFEEYNIATLQKYNERKKRIDKVINSETSSLKTIQNPNLNRNLNLNKKASSNKD